MSYLINHAGINWNYYLSGRGEEKLLFIHGWGVDGRIWKQQVKHFSHSCRVMSIDLPGHGSTGWKDMTFAQMAEGILMLMEREGFFPVSIIGSSLGGLMALKIFELSPDNIKKMVFVGSMPKFSKTQEHPYGLDIGKFRKLSGQLDTSYPAIINVFFRSLFTIQERSSRRYKWLQRFRRKDIMPDREALRIYLNILENEDLRDVLRRVDIPVQFINGCEDTICCMETFSYLKSIIPDARYDSFNECGHFPFLSKPYKFNEILEDFLLDSYKK